MNHRIKVTIGLCVKNAGQTIKDALRSILKQDFPHELLELIIVDGCSKDKTLSIIQGELSKVNIKSKIFRESKGLGYARQIVVNNTSGDYIVWVDGDMVLPRNFVKKQVEFMEQNPKVGIGKAKYGLWNVDNLSALLEDVEFVVSFSKEGRTFSKALGTSGCIYRAEAIRQAGGFDENIVGGGEDTDAECRVKANGWLLYITPGVFYERRRATWKSLWDEYFWLGYGARHLFRKNKKAINVYKMFPPIAVASELLRASHAYKLLYRKVVFLLPFHYVFKRIAWLLGFIKGTYVHMFQELWVHSSN
jgi:glycosyltransferase involved in cell wall biosynthesis